MAEIWKSIPGYEGFYEVSNLGRVRSLPRNGTIKKIKVLSLSLDKDGYNVITLNKLGTHKTKKVHRLVAEAFLEKIDNKEQINHKDGNKTNNTVKNLEWCSCLENNRHRCKVLGFGGVPHHCKKVKCIETGEIFQSTRSAARAYGGFSCNLRNSILGKGQKRFAGYHWEYVNTD